MREKTKTLKIAIRDVKGLYLEINFADLCKVYYAWTVTYHDCTVLLSYIMIAQCYYHIIIMIAQCYYHMAICSSLQNCIIITKHCLKLCHTNVHFYTCRFLMAFDTIVPAN